MALEDEYLDALRGLADTGDVWVRNFDEGVVRTMGAEVVTMQHTGGFGANYYLTNVPNVTVPPDHPGIPVVFAIPEDVFEEYRIPVVVVKRTGINNALVRRHPFLQQYRIPAPGAQQVTVGERTGYTHYVTKEQALPFDITYTIRIIARNRGGFGQSTPRAQANALFIHIAKRFKPHCTVFVPDTKGDIRGYYGSAEYGVEDEILDVTGRTVGFTVDLTVQGQLDLDDPITKRAITSYPDFNYETKDD